MQKLLTSVLHKKGLESECNDDKKSSKYLFSNIFCTEKQVQKLFQADRIFFRCQLPVVDWAWELHVVPTFSEK
jgi:hypothetical protein